MTPDTLTIWTIGHSTRTLEEFVSLLTSHRIELVADVRAHPGSRKHPHFGRDTLAASLEAAGIDYRHFPELGGRRLARPDSPNTAWRNTSFRGYADYMQTEPFREGLERLLAAARSERTAIMCSEAVWWRCHRSMIADALKAGGVRVLHIVGATKVQEHPYTSAASIVDGQLSYAAPSSAGSRAATVGRPSGARGGQKEIASMGTPFRVGDHVEWNSEAGRVRGTIKKKVTSEICFKGYTVHASREAPQYLIKSDKTDHLAMHKGSALKRIPKRGRAAGRESGRS